MTGIPLEALGDENAPVTVPPEITSPVIFPSVITALVLIVATVVPS